EAADELLAQAIAPQLELVGHDGMDAELTGLAALHPLGPGVAEQAVAEEAKVMRQPDAWRHADAFAAEARLLQGDLVFGVGQIGVHGAAGAGAGLEGIAALVGELERDVGEGDVVFIADVTDEHEKVLLVNV